MRFFTKIQKRIADPIDPQRKWILWILHKQQNWIQNDDSLAQKSDKKSCCLLAAQGTFERYQLPFRFSKKATKCFFRNTSRSQRKQIWTKENSCVSPLLRYLCYVMLCSILRCKNDTPANSSDQQFISLNTCTTCILYAFISFHYCNVYYLLNS